MAALFRDIPEAIANTRIVSERLEFTLANLGYEFPHYPMPEGETMDSFLAKRVEEGVRKRYGSPAKRHLLGKARAQVRHELALIAKLGFAGYFLIVWDIIRYCQWRGFLVQGRGSAANSAVCYALEITAVDPVGMELLFERFLSENRGEWPDIDLDLASGDEREQVIQYVYERYGALGAAMTANVITYRGRSAAREVGKALGFEEEQSARLSGLMGHWEWRGPNDTMEKHFAQAGFDVRHPRIARYLDLCLRIKDLPRHLGQHSGGMVICAGLLNRVVPIERASMPGRTVIQWDKEDCADMGLIKVDLLGLGMMAALKDAIELIPRHYGKQVDLALLPEDPLVYETLRKADTVGMFQVESRAQMASIPHNAPVRFYDLVVQVAIIRPGPIVGKMMHPYMRRQAGQGGGDVSASVAGAGAEADVGRAAVSGAVAAHGDDGGELYGRGGRGAAARGGHAAIDAADEGPGGAAARGDDAQRRGCGGAGQHRAGHLVVCHVRISREPCGELRADRVCVGVSEGALSGGVHVRIAEQPADGVLFAGGAGEGCAAARAARAAHRRSAVGVAVHAGAESEQQCLF